VAAAVLGQDVEDRLSQMPTVELGEQVLLDDVRAAREVDQARARGQRGEPVHIEQAACFGSKGSRFRRMSLAARTALRSVCVSTPSIRFGVRLQP
jgi:hypothetical protein